MIARKRECNRESCTFDSSHTCTVSTPGAPAFRFFQAERRRRKSTCLPRVTCTTLKDKCKPTRSFRLQFSYGEAQVLSPLGTILVNRTNRPPKRNDQQGRARKTDVKTSLYLSAHSFGFSLEPFSPWPSVWRTDTTPSSILWVCVV